MNAELLADFANCSGHSVAVDLETTGLEWFKDIPIGVGWFCPGAESEGYIDLREDGALAAVQDVLLKLWDSDRTTVICHNMKFDFHFLGISPRHFKRKLDTTVMIHLIDSRHRKALKDAEVTFLEKKTKTEHLALHGRTKIWDWPVEDVAKYCIDDCRSTWELAEYLMPFIRKMFNTQLLKDDMEYLGELWEIERYGMRADLEFTKYAVARLQQDIDFLEGKLFEGIGYKFNWRSAKQLSKALYEDMGIEKPKDPYADADGVYRGKFAHRTKYNSASTNTFILLEKVIWTDENGVEHVGHPLGEVISLLREARKLQNVLEKWPKLVDDEGRLHTNFNITGTRTGRLSSSKPNLQNVPGAWRVKFTQTVFSGELDRPDAYNLRKGIIPDPGTVLVSIDWRQQELRMFGLLAKDPNMVPALEDGRDIHSFVADQVWGDHNVFHRGMAKSITFGLIYGTSTASLSHRLNMTRYEAKAVTDQYWSAFPAIRPFRDATVEQCLRHGYVRNWAGRYWWEESQEHVYRAVNFLVQGGAADQLKHAIIRCQKFLREVAAQSHPVSIVHDEIIFQMPWDELWMVPDICRIMELPDIFGVAFPVDVEMGLTWGEKKEIPEEALPLLMEGKRPKLPVDEKWKAEWAEMQKSDIDDPAGPI
jgi:DNA polymerase-1